jgi:hypothetical protein
VRAEVLFEDVGTDLGDALADFTFRVVDSPKDARPDRTGLDARRRLPTLDSVVTPRALVSRSGSGIDKSNAVGTSLNTVGTANTALGIDELDPFR